MALYGKLSYFYNVFNCAQGSALGADIDTEVPMDTDIKKIEDLSLNAWPSHQMQMYDGWILRFSYFYTHRTNCAETVGVSLLPLTEKIEYCERIYDRWKTPCIFKISPICDPALDGILEERGYRIEHTVDNMTADLLMPGTARMEDAESGSSALSEHGLTLRVEDRVSKDWVNGLFTLKHTEDPVHLRIVPSMYDAIPMDEIAVSVTDADGRIAGTGLGILDRNYIGIYAIHVREDLRRMGLARLICTTLLARGKLCGAEKAYLQCVTDNLPAKRLYRSLGFRKFYTCWFRVKDLKER